MTRISAQVDAPKYVVADRGRGCVSLDDLHRLNALSLQKDEIAFGKLMRDLVIAGRCPSLARGAEMIIEDTSFKANAHKARRKGDPVSYWVPREFIGTEKMAAQ